MQVGFIGLGTMGASMAANLQKAGHELVVHDVAPRRGRQPHRATARSGPTRPKAVAEQREVDLHLAARAARGRGGGARAERAARRHARTPPISTCRPIRRPWCARSHAAFAEKDVHMLDAPVSGGPGGAAIGQAGDLGRRRRGRSSTQHKTRARRDRRPGALHRPDRRRLGRQARAQLRRLRRPVRAGRGLHAWASRPASSRWRCGRRCAGRRRPAAHLRRAGRPVPARQVRPAGLRAAPGAQGRDAGDRSSAASSACRCASGQPGARRNDRGAEPRLGDATRASHAAAAGARGRVDRGRPKPIEAAIERDPPFKGDPKRS